MKQAESPVFNGFSTETIGFFAALAANNEKPWFNEHRGDFVRYVQEPMVALATGLAPTMTQIDPNFVVAPGKIISRIHRDTRFSADKSPYRTNMWLGYTNKLPGWESRPGFYFDLGLEGYSFGMGYYVAKREVMDGFREKIRKHSDEFLKMVSPILEHGFHIEGETYKRPLAPELDPALSQWYERKSFYLDITCQHDKTLFSSTLLDYLKEAFSVLAPLYSYL